jgi:hypothetical protein
MDVETEDLLRGSIREMFATGDADIVSSLHDLGWDDVMAEDPDSAIDLLFSEQGAAGKASSALSAVAVATDTAGVTHPVVHPVGATTPVHIADAELRIDGVVLAEPTHSAVVAAPDGSTYLIDVDALTRVSTPVAGFSPASRLRRVQLRIAVADAAPIDVEWTAVCAAAQRALAAELVGNGTAMLRVASEQITERHQFGRPIGANQGPRHRLAESFALVRGAAELVRMAWQSGSPWDARVAKAYAGQALESTSRACLQVCGAIGLTTEHSLPGYVQRARILDALYGGWSTEISDIGAHLIAATVVPPGDLL